MGWLTHLVARLRALRHRDELDADLEAELAHHLEMKRLRETSSDREARLALGNTTRWKEETREQWRFAYLESLWSDIAYAARLLRKDRVFTLVALVTLTLGIGANTAIFGVLNSLLWRPLPVDHPEQIVRIPLTNLPPNERQWTNGREEKAIERRTMPFPMYETLVKRQQIFSGMFAIAGGGSMATDINGVMRQISVTTVSGSYFPVLGLRPQLGRLLEDSDDLAGGPSGWSAVISDRVWSQLFARSPSVVGTSMRIEQVPFTIAGVAPPSFKGTTAGAEQEVWIPLSAMETIFPGFPWRTSRDGSTMQVMARLKSGVTIVQAKEHLGAIAPAVLEEARNPAMKPEDVKNFVAMRFDPIAASSGQQWILMSFGNTLWILLAAVGAVLLIAVTNLTNLFLARSAARSREVAVRLALGAPASRIRRQLLLESGLLAIAGTAGGLVAASWLTAAVQAAVSRQNTSIQIDISLDWRMFAFLAFVLAAVVLIAGLAPAIASARVSLQNVWRTHTAGFSASYLRRALIVLQTALSMALLAGAALMASSLQKLVTESSGFESESAVFVSPDLLNAGIPRDRMSHSYQTLLSDARLLPNVISAAWTQIVPLGGALMSMNFAVEGGSELPEDQRSAYVHTISDGYFSTVGIPLLLGRDFRPGDFTRKPVCLISESAARDLFGSPQQAVGRHVKSNGGEWMEVLGVVGDAKYGNIREPRPPTLYRPDPNSAPGMTLAVRYRGSQEPVINALQSLFTKEAGRLPFVNIATVEGNIRQAVGPERLLAWLLGGFSLFALLICATGLSGLLSYTVEQRRKEIGIRMTLGATAQRVRREIQWQGFTLTLIGLGCGAALSYALRRSLDAYLFGISPGDPMIWIFGIAVLLAASLAAAAIPAWKAARIHPIEMLRQD